MNVIGTRADDEWWRDRHGAMVKLVHLLERWVASSGEDVTVVFEQPPFPRITSTVIRSEEHTSELQSRRDLVCRLLLEKKKKGHGRHALRRGVRNGSTLF